LPLEALRAFDAQIEARIDRLILTNKLPIEALAVIPMLQNGHLVIDPLLKEWQKSLADKRERANLSSNKKLRVKFVVPRISRFVRCRLV